MMTRIIIFAGLFLSFSATLAGQAERKYIRQGNREYKGEKFDESEILYRRALEKDEGFYAGEFNLGDALYKQEQYEDAARNFKELTEKVDDPAKLSHLYHNLGNSLLQANQLEASIDAYKNALRNNPMDEETRHNLAFAQNMLQQQQQQQDQQNQDQDQDQQDQDQQDQNQDQQQDEQDQQQDQQQDQDQQNKDQEQQDQQQQKQQQQISREDAERMLQALQEDEQKLQEKLKKQQARAQRVRVLKDW
jgi:tetratricopeptide (TPR) repeat protein